MMGNGHGGGPHTYSIDGDVAPKAEYSTPCFLYRRNATRLTQRGDKISHSEAFSPLGESLIGVYLPHPTAVLTTTRRVWSSRASLQSSGVGAQMLILGM